jgi:hypothetical protein
MFGTFPSSINAKAELLLFTVKIHRESFLSVMNCEDESPDYVHLLQRLELPAAIYLKPLQFGEIGYSSQVRVVMQIKHNNGSKVFDTVETLDTPYG